MQRQQVTESVEVLLADLHEKKRWLDMMIGGLEAAVSSPEHQLITSVEKAFESPSRSRGSAELLSDRKTGLATLAQSVHSSPHARRKRSLEVGQAVST